MKGSPNIVRLNNYRRLRWAGHVARILTGTHVGKRPLGRSRRRWEDNIRMDDTGIDINTRNWLDFIKTAWKYV